MNNNFLTLIAAGLLLLSVAAAGQKEKEEAKWVELEGDELESQLSINPSDAEETSKLEGRLLLFSDFCVQGRDHVMGDVKRSARQLVGSVAGLFLGSFDLLNIDERKVREAAEKHGAPVTTPEEQATRAAAIRAAEETEVGDSLLLEERSEPRRAGARFPNPFGPIVWAISAIGSTIGHQVIRRLEQLGRTFGLDKLQAAVGGTCDRIGGYERHLRRRFARVRDELVRELGLDEADDFRRLNLEQLPCMTLGRVLRLQGVCRFGDNLQRHPLLNVLVQGRKVAKLVQDARSG